MLDPVLSASPGGGFANPMVVADDLRGKRYDNKVDSSAWMMIFQYAAKRVLGQEGELSDSEENWPNMEIAKSGVDKDLLTFIGATTNSKLAHQLEMYWNSRLGAAGDDTGITINPADWVNNITEFNNIIKSSKENKLPMIVTPSPDATAESYFVKDTMYTLIPMEGTSIGMYFARDVRRKEEVGVNPMIVVNEDLFTRGVELTYIEKK